MDSCGKQCECAATDEAVGPWGARESTLLDTWESLKKFDFLPSEIFSFSTKMSVITDETAAGQRAETHAKAAPFCGPGVNFGGGGGACRAENSVRTACEGHLGWIF